jgi:hypothetical protein
MWRPAGCSIFPQRTRRSPRWWVHRVFCGWVLAATCLAAGPSNAAMTSPFRVGAWSGGAYLHDQTKAFQHCAATGPEQKGTSISYSVNPQFQWGVTISNPSWNFVKGASLNLVLRIAPGNDALGTTALVRDRSTLELQIKDAIAVFSKLRSARELRVVIGGHTIELPLEGSDEALTALTQCVMHALKFRQNAKTKNSILDSHNTADAGVQDEAKALRSNINAYAASRNAQLLATPEGFGDLPVDVAWKVGIVTAGITVRGTQASIEDIRDAIIERSVRSCRGGFFLAPLSGTIDQSDIVRIFTTCQMPEATATLYNLLIERPKGGFYILSLRSLGGNFGGVMQKAVDEYEDRIRAVIMVAIRKLDG